jgi:hypothetical protein
MLARGVIKRVGLGDINVWEDNWIPGVRSLKPLIRLQTTIAERVHELFILGTRTWNIQVVQKYFMAIEVAEVLKIKPSDRLERDVLAWAHERHGQYSVKSAYRLLKTKQMEKAMADSREASGSGASAHWSTLWKLEVPPKVQVFWWRVLHNSLPSKMEMKQRHIAKKSHCEMCGHQEETLFHVFFDCPLAKRFWREVKKVMGITVPDLHPWSWATDILLPRVCAHATVAVVVCGAWDLWTGRNARDHGWKTWEPGATTRFISALMEDLVSLRQPKKQKLVSVRARW